MDPGSLSRSTSLGRNVVEREPTTRIGGEDIPSVLVGAAILVILLGIAGFWVLARNTGTGDAEAADVRARFRSFAEAVADGDGSAACDMIVPEIAESFAERAALNLGSEPGTCPEMIVGFADGRSPDHSTLIRGVEVLDVRMLGADTATNMPPESAEVEIEAGVVSFERRSGCAGAVDCWLVHDGGPIFRMADPSR